MQVVHPGRYSLERYRRAPNPLVEVAEALAEALETSRASAGRFRGPRLAPRPPQPAGRGGDLDSVTVTVETPRHARPHPLAEADRPARPRARLRAGLPDHDHARVPVGHEPGVVVRPLPHLRRALDRAAARRDRRVRTQHPEEVRRHGAAAGRAEPARAAQRPGPAGDPADQPDARGLRHRARRHALRAEHVRRHAEALDGRLRLAAVLPRRGARERPLLRRAGPADGHQGRAADLRRLRVAARRSRAGALRLRRGRSTGRGRDHGVDPDVLPGGSGACRWRCSAGP